METSQLNNESPDILGKPSQGISSKDSSPNDFDMEQKKPQQFRNEAKPLFEDPFLDCYGAIHLPLYQHGESFDKLTRKMTVVKHSEGKIKKRMLREGYGSVLPDISLVSIFYHAYFNKCSKPFISTRYTFRLNDEKSLRGIRIAVQTMKMNEISQFLMHGDYARRQGGHMREMPPDSAILYEIETRQFVEYIIYMPGFHKQDEFFDTYQHAFLLCAKGNNLYSQGSIKEAIKVYNIAESKLDECAVTKFVNYQMQHQLLKRLRSNLIVAYTKLREPHYTCLIYNRLHYMCRRSRLKIPLKVYFNHARSLSLLSHYECAEKQLKRARYLDPLNSAIVKEFFRVDTKKKAMYDREMALAKIIFRNTEINREPHDKSEITPEYEDFIVQYCKDLTDDDNSVLYNLPNELTKTELEFTKKEAVKCGLELKCSERCGVDICIIIKPSKMD